MVGDLGAAQEAIKLLVTEPGLAFIKALSDRYILTVGSPSSTLWETAIRPLFRILTHPRVVDSAVLEQEVATSFNFLLGVGGSRITRLASYITNLVDHWPSSTESKLSRMEAVELTLAVLSKIVDVNTTTIVNQQFSNLLSPFSKLLEGSSPTPPEEEFSRLQASNYLDYIKRRLQVGDDIKISQAPSQLPVIREQFVLRRDLPGHLSADGPRHDNDHAEIPRIKILPTYEEIVSPRAEYLPTNDPSQWHIQGILGRLDREFRLIREDTVGQLRDAVRDTLEKIRSITTHGQHSRRDAGNNSGARTTSYDFPTPMSVDFSRDGGLEITVRCNQVAPLRDLEVRKQGEWWAQSKRLQAGALVCVFNDTGSVLFCVVSESTMRNPDDKRKGRGKREKEESQGQPLTLSDGEFLHVRLQLVDPGAHEIGQALRWFQPMNLNPRSSPRRYLVEFPGVLLASFKHTLTALQQMYTKPRVPFHELIAPSKETPPDRTVVKPPQYMRKAGFMLDARCLTTNGADLNLSPSNPPRPSVIKSRTTLDFAQSAALANTLSRELSLIQGPPGTGKSYIGEQTIRLLLANKEKTESGPILCVCYTNHALDQLLEHLVDDGVKGIIRIGSGSKSERLQDLNLRVVAQALVPTKSEKGELYQLNGNIHTLVSEGQEQLEELGNSRHWRTVKAFLAAHHSHHHSELFGTISEVDEGWETVKHKPGRIIDNWLRGGAPTPTSLQPRELEVLKRAQLQTMSTIERHNIYRHWLKSIRDPMITQIIATYRDYSTTTEQRNRLRGDLNLRCLQEAEVIGVTTTGLARQLDILRKLRCKVMVCEEAGEVLEGHILTALIPSVEHAILIGDHLQLRPQIQNYELQSVNPRGERYSLDVSLFERLVQPPSHESAGLITCQVPFSVLETQRRMHPSISELIRTTLYPSLKDAPNVSQYPEVLGMKRRLFWMHHDQFEAGHGKGSDGHDPLGTSRSNDFEVEMTTALVSHIVRQGEYGKEDIAVITPYLGQLQKLRRRMQSMFEICLNDRDLDDVEKLDGGSDDGQKDNHATKGMGKTNRSVAKTTLLNSVRIATVDNFQGEEAKVVIISLVRSNPQQNCGFLKTSNRINVLLSRAKHGMFIIGNADTYGSVPMWAEVLGILKKQGNFGPAIELQCPRHPATPIFVSTPDHFLQFAPESGCNLPCDKRLRCGHSCNGRCHAHILHEAVKCLEDCPRPQPGGCNHACPLRCGDACREKCLVPLTNLDLTLPCGHRITSAKCWETKQLASVKCTASVTRRVPGCNHEIQVECHVDVTNKLYRCMAPCGHNWASCGHTCPNLCYQCRPERKDITVGTDFQHGVCLAKCGRNYKNCRHSCEQKCHEISNTPCPPCPKPCEVRCGHSKCGKQCHEPCAPCAEQHCNSSCPHGACTMPCAAPCNWVPCSLRCGETMTCGHQCPSVCGEPCPGSYFCQECSSDTIKATCVDFLEMQEYHEIDLDLEPCIFPDCGHFLTVTSMDGQMNMGEYYMLDANGLPAGVSKPSEPFSMDQSEAVRVCPTCRGSLRNIARYGRIVRRGMLDEATKKFIAWSNGQYLNLAEALAAEQESLANTKLPDGAVTCALQTRGTLTSRLDHFWCLRQIHQPVPGKKGGKTGERYRPAIKLWDKISAFGREVRKEEQPFQRVADLVTYANNLRRQRQLARLATNTVDIPGSEAGILGSMNPGGPLPQTKLAGQDEHGSEDTTEFNYDESVIQAKGQLLAKTLLLKCDVMMFDDLVRLVSDKKITLSASLENDDEMDTMLGPSWSGMLNVEIYLKECDKLIGLAKDTKHPKEQVQGHVFAALFCGFARALGQRDLAEHRDSPVQDNFPVLEKDELDSNLKQTALKHISLARAITEEFPTTISPPSTLAAEIDSANRFLTEGTFYEAVTPEELRAVYKAMSNEFRGTGHWYTCQNNHPFTVGECGMPMEQARCPECGASVGGLNHQPVAGVRRDGQMEEMARGIDGLRI